MTTLKSKFDKAINCFQRLLVYVKHGRTFVQHEMTTYHSLGNFLRAEIIIEPSGGDLMDQIDWHHACDQLNSTEVGSLTGELRGSYSVFAPTMAGDFDILFVLAGAKRTAEHRKGSGRGTCIGQGIEGEGDIEYLLAFAPAYVSSDEARLQ